MKPQKDSNDKTDKHDQQEHVKWKMTISSDNKGENANKVIVKTDITSTTEIPVSCINDVHPYVRMNDDPAVYSEIDNFELSFEQNQLSDQMMSEMDLADYNFRLDQEGKT